MATEEPKTLGEEEEEETVLLVPEVVKEEKQTFDQVASASKAVKAPKVAKGKKDKNSSKSISDKVEGKEALNNALSLIEKQFGKGSIYKLGDNANTGYPHLETGILDLDIALGIGGLPIGRIIEIYGPESSGKTTLCLSVIAKTQQEGGVCAFIDAEHALDPTWAKTIGVSIDDLLVAQPDNGEEALEMVESLVRSNSVNLIVVDSVASLVPRAEIEGDMGDSHMGLQARLMSQALRKLTGVISKSSTTVIFINQLRCLPENTLVNINGQLKRLVDVNKGDMILKSNDEFVVVNDKILSDVVEGVLLTCKYRGDIRLSTNHKQPVISGGSYVIKQGKDVKAGDWLLNPILKSDNLSNDIPYVEFSFTEEFSGRVKQGSLYKVGDEKLALLCGMFFSDGYLNDDPDNSFISFTENDTERHTLVKDLCEEIFPDYASSSNNTVIIRGLKPITYLKSIGLVNKGAQKKIPTWIISSKRDVIKSFIRGCFFDTHGFNNQGFIFTCESDETETFHKLLIHLGVFSDLRSDSRKYDRLYFTGSDAITFTQEIGFLEKKKQIASTLFSPTENCRGKYDVAPHALGYVIFESIRKKIDSYSSAYKKASACSWSKLNFSRENLVLLLSLIQDRTVEENEWYNLLKLNRFTEIQNISSVSFKAVDIEVDKELFIADNFLTHNSKIGVLFGSPETTCVTPDTFIEIISDSSIMKIADDSKSIQIQDLFTQLGYDYQTMPEDHTEDVSDQNIKIKSFDLEKNAVVFNRILQLVRKKDSPICLVKTLSGDILLKCTAEHRVYSPTAKDFVPIMEATDILTDVGDVLPVEVERLDETSPILDITVEDTENYYSNSILSHNTGGNALKFYASVRMDIRKIDTIKQGEESIANRVRVKMVKNKLAPPFTQCEFDLYFASGFSRESSIVDLAVKHDIIAKAGSWYSYNGEKIGQGKEQARVFLVDNPDIADKLEKMIRDLNFGE